MIINLLKAPFSMLKLLESCMEKFRWENIMQVVVTSLVARHCSKHFKSNNSIFLATLWSEYY